MQSQLTELEKCLYNKHLAVSRSSKNKPFKTKKDFGNIVDTDKHKFLKRISILFKKHPEINPDLFFQAPYKLYPDVTYFDLEYFSTMRAVKAYTTYKKQQFLQDPDSQIKEVKESLRFIANFCVQNKIQFYQYPSHQTSDAFTWMAHYKENKINVYTIMEFPDVYSTVQSLADDVKGFFVGEFIEQFKNLYALYTNSVVVRPYIKKAMPTLTEFVYNQINKD